MDPSVNDLMWSRRGGHRLPFLPLQSITLGSTVGNEAGSHPTPRQSPQSPSPGPTRRDGKYQLPRCKLSPVSHCVNGPELCCHNWFWFPLLKSLWLCQGTDLGNWSHVTDVFDSLFRHGYCIIYAGVSSVIGLFFLIFFPTSLKFP